MIVSWLKLDVNILNDTKIKVIRKYPDGDALFVLWVGMLCLAMKSDNSGFIYITQGIPFTPQDLAAEFDIQEKTVLMGLEVFRKLNMIDFAEGGVIEIINFDKHQDTQKIETIREQTRIRQARFKENKRKAMITQGNALLTRYSCVDNASVTEESRAGNDTDKIREDEIRGEEKREESAADADPSARKRFIKPTEEEVYTYFVSIGIDNPSVETQKFFSWYEGNGWKVGKNPMKDWRATCRTWKLRRDEDAKSSPRRNGYKRPGIGFNPDDPDQQAALDRINAAVGGEQ